MNKPPDRIRRPTRNDVARRANVSGWTVSNVLNGRNNVSISEQTRRRVLEAAEWLGYQPNNSARALATGQTRTIGFWMCLGYSRYRSHVLHRMQQLIRQSDFEIVIRDIEEGLHRDGDPSNVFRIPVDGVIAFDTPTAARMVAGMSLPFVSMGAYWTDETDHVGIDLYSGAVDAVKHLVDTGRRNIAYLLPRRETEADFDDPRIVAYTTTMREAGLPTRLIYAADLSLATSWRTVRQHVSKDRSIDGLLCHDDGMAFGAHRALSDLGVAIGPEIALIGFDGIDETEYLSPPLTTIAQPAGQMCETAWRFLRARIEDPGRDPQQQTLPTKLVIRQSSMPAGAVSRPTLAVANAVR